MKFVLLNCVDGKSVYVCAKNILMASNLPGNLIHVMLDDNSQYIITKAQVSNQCFYNADDLIRNIICS